MQRVLINSSTRVIETLVDGFGAVASPPQDVAQVTITNDAGVELGDLLADPTGNNSEFSVELNTVMTSLLDRLTLVWTNATVGNTVTVVEVVGGFLFTLEELRAQSTAFASLTDYPNSKLADIRTTVEQALEDACGVAFVPRYGSAVLNSDYTISRSDLRVIRGPTGQTRNGVALVGYEYGQDYPPARVKQAALILAKAWGSKGPIDSRTTSFTSPETGITSTFATTGKFGIPEVDSVVEQYEGGTVGGFATVPMSAYTGPVWT